MDLTTLLLARKIPPDKVNASSIDGVIGIEHIPPVALERLVVVADEAERFSLTTDEVQIGDTVKQNDTGLMYLVIDIDHLDSEQGYEVYKAGTAASVPWGGITDKPAVVQNIETIVPVPTNDDSDKFLKGDGTWAIASEETYFSQIKALEAIRPGYLICGNASGLRELRQGRNFVITYPMLFSTKSVAKNEIGYDCGELSGVVNLKLTNNDVDCGFEAFKAVYVKGSLEGVVFTVTTDNAFTQDVPATDDGFYYYLLGYAINLNEIELYPYHEVCRRDQNGWFGPVGANNLTAGTGISIANGQISLNLENAEEGEF